jgi:hypothetical protein
MTDLLSTVETYLADHRPILGADSQSLILAAVRETAPAQPAFLWALVAERFGAALTSALATPVGKLIKDACEEIVEDARPGADAATAETKTEPLHQFTLQSVHHPHVDVLLGPKRLFTAKFEVTFTLTVSAVEVTLKHGRIIRIGTGGYQGSESVTLVGVNKPLEFSTKEFKLPGEILFTDEDDRR